MDRLTRLHDFFRLGDGYLVDPARNEIRRGAETHALEPKVMEVLCFLAARAGEVLSRQEIIDAVWGVAYGGDESLTRAISLLRKALPPDEATETSLPALANQRRGKGQKANKKRMAAVGAVYTIQPFVRTAADVIEEVMRKEARARRPQPQKKRVRAELLVGKVALFLWLADEVIRRNPQGSKPVIFLSDGERALHDRQSEYLPEKTICILDLFHVMERLWKVAWCFFEERTQKRAAHQWVEERLRRLLEGKVAAVIRGIRYQATQLGLKGQKKKTVRDAAEYFERNRDRMKYDEYLAAGYPIGSGVVEGACRHLVKDRLERTGMRWLPSGAQAMLDLRATYLNGEWNDFWIFHVAREDERLYGKIRDAG